MIDTKKNTNVSDNSSKKSELRKTPSFKMLTFPCDFKGQKQGVNFYIGSPSPDSHPIAFQMKWLSTKGGTVPSNIVDALQRLSVIAREKNIPFVQLCEYVIANLK